MLVLRFRTSSTDDLCLYACLIRGGFWRDIGTTMSNILDGTGISWRDVGTTVSYILDRRRVSLSILV